MTIREPDRSDVARSDIGVRLYRTLLLLYPRDFRRRYGGVMIEFFQNRRHDAYSRGEGSARIWARALADLVVQAGAERATSVFAALRPRGPETHGAVHTTSQRTPETMSALSQDLRYAVRGMLQRPAFTAIVLATLTLGIGVNAAIFSVVNGVLLKPLPFRDADRIVDFTLRPPYSTVSEPEFMDYKRDVPAFDHLAAFDAIDVTLTGEDEPERVAAARVSDGFFTVLGVAPTRGRVFTAAEDTPKGARVVILAQGLWKRRYGGDPHIVGRDIIVGDEPATVVGIMPADFDYPATDVELWVPLRLNPDSLWTRNNHYLRQVGHLASGATLAGAAAQVASVNHRWIVDYPNFYQADRPLAAILTPIRDVYVKSTRLYLIALFGAVGFVLLIACANVANLLLARGEARRQELAIRTALGASRRRLATQLLTESALLSLTGGALGLGAAWLGEHALIALAPGSIPRIAAVHIDGVVVVFTIVISLATGILFGLVPAVRAARGNSAETLKESGRTGSQRGGVRQARRALVIAEVALAVVMLTGAGLLLRSLRTLQTTNLGFDSENALTARMSLPRAYASAATVQFYRELTSRLAAAPGVRAAAAMGWTPIAGGGGMWSIEVDGHEPTSIADAPAAAPEQVTPGFFKAMDIAIIRGRGFTDADREDAPLVAVVNETMAKERWPGVDPVGHTFRMFKAKAQVTVIGVARDIRSSGIQSDTPPTMYFPHAQAGTSAYFTPSAMTVVVRTSGDPIAATAIVRRTVRDLDPNIPLFDVQTLDHVVGSSIAGRTFTTVLLAGFAALALALAAIGIYGVVSYGVSQRTYEIGLRMALGAEQRSVLTLVVSEGLRMTLIGLGIGLLGALMVTRIIRSLLVGVTTTDIPTMAGVTVLLMLVALVASVLPARRAMRVSPTEALRGG